MIHIHADEEEGRGKRYAMITQITTHDSDHTHIHTQRERYICAKGRIPISISQDDLTCLAHWIDSPIS
jgi:hypothetical protein